MIGDYVKGRLLGTLFGKYSRKWGREEAILEAIASAHNDGVIDVLSIVTDEALEAIKRHGYFSDQQLYCKLIPRLNADAGVMIGAVDCLIRAAGQDLVGGLPGKALGEWCAKEQVRSGEFSRWSRRGTTSPSASSRLLCVMRPPKLRQALVGHLHRAAAGSDRPARANAIYALGQFDPAGDGEWTGLLQTLHGHAQDE